MVAEAASKLGRWPRRLAMGTALAVALFALVGFLVAPPVARRVAEKQLGTLLGRRVTIGRVRVNPFALSLTVERFQVFEADGTSPFAGFRRLYVNAQLSSVYRRAPVVKEVTLEGLRVAVVRGKGSAEDLADTADYNFGDILAHLAARPAEPPQAPAPDTGTPRFSVNNIRLIDAAITFDDRVLHSRHEITALNLGVPFVSTLPVYVDSFVEPGLSVQIDGTPFALAGHTKPFTDSLETRVDLRLDALDLTKYLPFVPVRLPFSLQSARLTVALELSFVRPRAAAPSLKVKGRVALEHLDVRGKRAGDPPPIVALETLDVHLGDSDVMAQQFRVDTVLVSGLDLWVRRLRDGTLNLQHLAPAGPASPPPAPKARRSGPSARFEVGAFTLQKATLHFVDESVTPTFRSDIREVAVSVRGLSNRPGAVAEVQARLRAQPGGVLTEQGTLRLQPLSADVTVAVDAIEPAKLAAYAQDLVAFDVVGGKVGLGAHIHFQQEPAAPRIRVSDGRLDVAGLELRRRGSKEPFFQMADLSIRGAALDASAQTVTVDEIATHDGRVRATRDRNGIVDLSTLAGPPAAGGGGSPSAQPASPPPPSETPGAAPWTVAVGRVAVERWSVRFEDRAISPTAVLTVNPLTLHISKLSTAPATRFGLDLHLGINKSGRFDVAGTAGLDPQTANLRFDLRGLEILPFQPYFADQVALTVTSGALSAKGQLGLSTSKGRGGAPGAPQLDLKGDVAVAELAVVDDQRHEPLVGWKGFGVDGLRVSNHPLSVAIDGVTLNDLDARLVMDADGGLNVVQALSPPAQPQKTVKTAHSKEAVVVKEPVPPAAKPASVPVNIGKLVLARGKLTFTDRSIEPRYVAEIGDLDGRVTGLSSLAGSTAAVDLSATVNHSGTLKVAGKTNPLADNLFLDLQLALRDVELPPGSPYSGKFVGYTISKGKLALSLDYKIANRKLDAKNNLVLDQFTFGDKVPSPVATKAPVRLAVALLKDRRGVIDVDLPITGSFDDPQFRVWPAVLKVLGNLVVKAATAPFSLIASAFGGGDQLSRVDFAPGDAGLNADAQRKLRSLGKALEERPGLSLEIEGGADPNRDRDGLRRFLVERKLKAQKVTELVQGGAAVASPDQVQIEPTERPRLLTAAYHGEKFAKPKNALGLEKSLPPAEMEQLLLQNTSVSDEDLRALALRRASALEGGLARNAPSAKGRLFLVAPRVAADGSHVELKLKKD